LEHTTLTPYDPIEERISQTPLPTAGDSPELGSTQNGSGTDSLTEQDKVLKGLRSGWLADYGINPERAHSKPAKLGPGLDSISVSLEVSSLVEKLTRDLPRAAVIMAKEAAELFFGSKVAGMLGGSAAVLLLGGVVVVGALVYASSVGHIFGRGAVASGGEADPERPGLSAINVDTTQPALISVPKTSHEDGVSTESTTLGSQGEGMAPNWNGGAAAAQSQVAVGEADAYPDASTPLQDIGSRGVASSEQHAEELARTAMKASSGRLNPGAGYQRAGAEQGSHSQVAMGDRGGLGVGGSGQSIARQSTDAPATAAVRGQSLQRSSVMPVGNTVAGQKNVSALERAQVMVATGASHGDVERTALDAIGNGGKAVFEVQHVDSKTGAVYPARILLTTNTVVFIPEAAGDTNAFSIPLRSMRVVGNASDAGLMKIEFNVGEKKEELSLRAAPTQAAALLAHVRNVIRSLQ
jgi:hypothetical protein